jgi:hypothetical protein
MSNISGEAARRLKKGFDHHSCPDNWQECNDARLYASLFFDQTPISYEWLQKNHGYGLETMNGVSKILNSVTGDPIEMYVNQEPEGDWTVSLHQSNEDDHVLITSRTYKTKGELRLLFAGLGYTNIDT